MRILLRFTAIALVVASVGLYFMPRSSTIPQPAFTISLVDPYANEVLEPYRRLRDALLNDDLFILAELADNESGYLAFRAHFALARHPEITAVKRLEHYSQVLELRVDDPLARAERQELYLEVALTAEVNGYIQQALAAYEEALPHPRALDSLERLQDNPYRLSNTLFKARLNRAALNALDGRTAPSIEAPAYRALGEHQAALDAYERWLAEAPDDLDARFGEAWSHFYLGNLDTAERLFAGLQGSSALYGRALIANRTGELDRAVSLLQQSGRASHLWLASGLLEAKDRYQDAIPVYLQLAQTDSVYADDAAYRALVLSKRFNDEAGFLQAETLIPSGSFFALKLGNLPELPSGSQLADEQHPVLELATALARAGNRDAAIGELLFALRDTPDEATAVAIAELLQSLGEYRQSQVAAQVYLSQGSQNLRTWRLAYPRAYPQFVEPEAAKRQLEPELIWAIMRQESAFYPEALSRSNAQGLMQVIPSTWDWLAELQREAPGDPFEPSENIRYGAHYLAWLHNYHSGDLELIITSYNRGQGYIRRLFEGPIVNRDKDEFYREIDALETREYLQKVVVNYRLYKALYQGETQQTAEASR
ncbi:MAG: transglycosylase SLT domain-containing protein [Trueperaceae bacterium]|nr:MAG: transglycosylase SLT domain-containing protein [Trueperaceae bacterium]